MLRFLTAGESHGPALTVIVEGLPAGLDVDVAAVNAQLARRQQGYGRGQRMAIESDQVEVLGGLRRGQTLGGPVAFVIRNRDWKNWQRTMAVERDTPPEATGAQRPPVTRPRPGHADLAGAIKYQRDDLRDILERASARETAARVAAGALARILLARVGIDVMSHVVAIGPVGLDPDRVVTPSEIQSIPATSLLRCVDAGLDSAMASAIDEARAQGDTLGGAFEVLVCHVPPGLGSYVQWDRKLDGRLAQALMSIPAIKAVGIGLGPLVAARPGSLVHDEIVLADGPDTPGVTGTLPTLARPTNRAGGLEGGVTNGEDIRVTGYMKPISTLMRPLRSVDLVTLADSPAAIERSDVCAVPAAAVVGEAMVALILADALLERFGADTVASIERHLEAVRRDVAARLERPGAADAGTTTSG